MGADPVGQVLGVQQREHPLHGVGVRRCGVACRVAAAPQRGQHLLISGGDPVGDVGQRDLSGEHRRRAQPQDRRQWVPNPAAPPRIIDRGEALHHVAAADPPQHRCPFDQHRHRGLGGRPDRRGTDRLHVQRSRRSDEGPSRSPRPNVAPLLLPAGHTRTDQPVIITQGHQECPPITPAGPPLPRGDPYSQSPRPAPPAAATHPTPRYRAATSRSQHRADLRGRLCASPWAPVGWLVVARMCTYRTDPGTRPRFSDLVDITGSRRGAADRPKSTGRTDRIRAGPTRFAVAADADLPVRSGPGFTGSG